jgi:DNA-binding Lrp family transcriptional regulator
VIPYTQQDFDQLFEIASQLHKNPEKENDATIRKQIKEIFDDSVIKGIKTYYSFYNIEYPAGDITPVLAKDLNSLKVWRLHVLDKMHMPKSIIDFLQSTQPDYKPTGKYRVVDITGLIKEKSNRARTHRRSVINLPLRVRTTKRITTHKK